MKALVNSFPWPHYKAPGCQPQAGELLFELVRESDHTHLRCELLDNGRLGVEVRILTRGELLMTYRFNSPTVAEQWARAVWEAFEKGGIDNDAQSRRAIDSRDGR